ncbi:MAG: hypothetical protein SXG53_29335 [Pseudomonadota bacterium]|nr:hypothetical protein [Pseudomonadota bacterium]
MAGRDAGRARIIVLWLCTGLFFLRVVGQVEALLLAPAWLPPMHDWYSGLLPYPLLLPAQIGILMLMSVLVFREMQINGASYTQPARSRRWLRITALVYFAVMVVRLAVQLARGAEDVIAAGGIPIAFHWILALFLLVLSRTERR